VARVNERWPEHRDVLAKSLAACSEEAKDTAHRAAELIERLAGPDLDDMIEGYRWMCEMIVEEEIHFRRNGTYRFSTFDEANREVYANAPLMQRYMAGVLLSQVLWSNHISCFDFYTRRYVAGLGTASRHLEVGPGHGLLLYKAAEREVAELVGWDVSSTSLDRTTACLEKLGVRRPVTLDARNVFAPLESQDHERFDSIVISEVLEHVERPQQALAALRYCLAPGGRIFINIPVNSPCIDHIYLWRTPEDVVELVRDAGFVVDAVHLAPVTGYTEARARKFSVAISVCIIAHI
jgi:2-polyprenyl-3-methyl-5-hydroxy-6-metoxy-1,4-benzoquinol methylase